MSLNATVNSHAVASSCWVCMAVINDNSFILYGATLSVLWYAAGRGAGEHSASESVNILRLLYWTVFEVKYVVEFLFCSSWQKESNYTLS